MTKRLWPEDGPTMTQDASEPKKAKEAGDVKSPPPRAAGEPQERPRRDLPTYDNLGPNAPPFERWFEQNIAYIREVQGQLQTPLDDSPAVMDAQVREAEAHGARMSSILSWADSYLDVAEHVALRKMPPRDPRDWTDMDREKACAAAVTRERRFRDVVKGICESIATRVSYAQSRMRLFSQAERQGMQP